MRQTVPRITRESNFNGLTPNNVKGWCIVGIDMNEKGSDVRAGEEKRKRTDVDTTVAVEKLELEQSLALGADVTVEYVAEFPEADIIAKDTENIRIAAGETIGGVKVTRDLRNIDGMVLQIKDVGKVLQPLVVSRREDGTFHLLQGFRRLNAVRRIRKMEPDTPLAATLSVIPVQVYTGLTPGQERALVNDQTAKSFNRSEVLQRVYDELQGGYHPRLVGERNYQLIGRVTGSEDLVRKIENETDAAKKKEALHSWMQNIMIQGWYACWKLGNPYRDMWLKTYLFEDGYTDEPPAVMMNTGRMKKISSAVKADQTAKEWSEKTGPRTAKLMEEFAEEDKRRRSGETRKRDKDRKTYRKISETLELIERYKEGGEDTLASRILGLCLKDAGDPQAIGFMANLERCRAIFREHADYIGTDLRNVLGMILEPTGDEADSFGEFLMDNYTNSRAARKHKKEIEEEPAAV